MCKSFHTNGYCPYGARCHFVHNANDESEMDDLYAHGGRGRSASSCASNDDNSQSIDKSLGALSLKYVKLSSAKKTQLQPPLKYIFRALSYTPPLLAHTWLLLFMFLFFC